MSGIYINELEMPKDGGALCIVIHHDGKVCHFFDLQCEQIATAIPVPPHGRLKDADALAEMLEKYKRGYALKATEDIVHLHKAWGLHEAELMAESLPIIISADPEKEGE